MVRKPPRIGGAPRNNPGTATCHVCHGEGIPLYPDGSLELHNERVVTPKGVSNGLFICQGSGEEPEVVEVDDAVS